MKTTTMEVTPSLAQKWLDGKVNHDNRDLSSSHIAYLAGEITAGRWRVTHQGIAFSVTGRLLDGQHRLHAIVEAGLPVRVMVTDGLEDDDFRAMDCGKRRAMKDRLHLVDDSNRNHLMCQAITAYLAATSNIRGAVSASAVEEAFLKEGHTEGWMWVGQHFDGAGARLRPAGVMAALAMYFVVDKRKAQSFIDSYLSGAGLEHGSPVLRMRDDAMGITGRKRAIDYWRSVSCLQSHRESVTVTAIYAASKDMVGNENTSREMKKRVEVRTRAAAKVPAEERSRRGAAASLSMPAEVRQANATKASHAAADKRRRRLA